MKRMALLILITLCCIGCASTYDSVRVTDEYIVSIEVAKENAIKIASVSEFKTCFIRACLGSHIDKLPYEMIVTLDGIDRLMKEVGEVANMTDCQKGQILGLWTRLVTLGVLEVVAEINPGILTGIL